ncbi:hypothetical protein Lesp02_67460 [Lentzea sp. NBRC 105346]|uniref:hypothetical protein n=1 Tax=Lentzea sp. NBRC 105346 TaxID=3032205 RepID=UPI0024A1D5C4|nr:hypothetical protein [Lentzea sp. NBRC 105346]GLZ34559.1 hypothetical protein Lesp02_67460 [Lentzea sp. NBRC 105346]
MNRATAAALLAVGVVLTVAALVLPLYSSAYPGGVEVIVRAWGTEIVNKPGDWPPGELSPLYAIPLTVTAAALAASVFLRRRLAAYTALGGAAAQVGAVGILLTLLLSEKGHVDETAGQSFSPGIGVMLLVVGTVAAVVGAIALQREAA